MNKHVWLVAVGMLTLSVAQANDGSSGCGAGWYLFKKNSLLSSSLRATTNASLLNQTFGMTFGTSNCAKHDIVMKDKEDIYFAEANHEYLVLEMAKGGGEYVTAFARTLGCDDAAVSGFARMSQQKYPEIFDRSDIGAHEMLDHVKAQLRQDPQLAVQCTKAYI